MRSRKEFSRDYTKTDQLIVEILLDCRSLLQKLAEAKRKKKAKKEAKDASS